jgi:Mor family transcriptional regulator
MTDAEDIVQILERLAAGEIDVEQLLALVGGRQWYFPTPKRSRVVDRYMAIIQFPSRDYKVVAKEFNCSPGVVYRAWNWGKQQTAS